MYFQRHNVYSPRHEYLSLNKLFSFMEDTSTFYIKLSSHADPGKRVEFSINDQPSVNTYCENVIFSEYQPKTSFKGYTARLKPTALVSCPTARSSLPRYMHTKPYQFKPLFPRRRKLQTSQEWLG